MRHDKLELQLQLMLLLIENHSYTIQDICKRMELSRRNLYYYLEFFRDAGFIVEHVKPYYRISKDSPFFRKLDATVHFTEDEAIAMRQILEQTERQHALYGGEVEAYRGAEELLLAPQQHGEGSRGGAFPLHGRQP